MVDQRAKGARGEYQVRDILREETGLLFERTPSSGALGENLKMKGDLFVPQETNTFTIEVKNYKDDQLSTRTLINKSDTFRSWWAQAEKGAKQNENHPMLIYKYNRGPWMVATTHGLVLIDLIAEKQKCERDFQFFVWYNKDNTIIICELKEMLKYCKEIDWIK